MRSTRAALLLAALLSSAGLAADSVPTVVIDRAALPQAVTDLPGFERRIFQDGRVYIAGQPNEEALKKLKERGVTLIVNFRTLAEVNDRTEVPYDEPAAVAALGMEYLSLPIGGETPFRPEVLQKVHEALLRHRGPVLLHCTVAWRASYVWAAYGAQYLGLDLDAALARGRAIGISEDPLSLLLGRKLKLVDAEPRPPQPTPAPLR